MTNGVTSPGVRTPGQQAHATSLIRSMLGKPERLRRAAMLTMLETCHGLGIVCEAEPELIWRDSEDHDGG